MKQRVTSTALSTRTPSQLPRRLGEQTPRSGAVFFCFFLRAYLVACYGLVDFLGSRAKKKSLLFFFFFFLVEALAEGEALVSVLCA